MKTLTLINKAFLLKKTSLFGKLDLDLLLTIAEKLEFMQFRSGEKIFQQNQEAHKMYFIIEGAVEIWKNEKLADLNRGEFFGDEALFNENTRNYEALCTRETSLLSLARSHLLSILHECPQVGIAFIEAYTAKLDFRKR